MIRSAAEKRGRRQINEAFAKEKATVAADAQSALRTLPAEIDGIITDLRLLH